MNKAFTVISCLFFTYACSSIADEGSEPVNIPSSVSSVSTELVGESVVRLIQHNMESRAEIQVEILSRPRLEPVKTKVLSALHLEGAVIPFSSGSGCFVEDVTYGEKGIDILFEFSPLKGGAQLYRCHLPITNNGFGKYECHSKS